MRKQTSLPTRERIRLWRKHDPYVTAAEIARGLRVSRERVRQLLGELGLPTRVPLRPVKPPKWS